MTIDEAIKHAEKVAEVQEEAAKEWHENQVRKCELIPFAEMDYTHENNCKKCADEHRQLAEWLKDYKHVISNMPSIQPKTDVLDKMRAEIDSYCSDNRDRNDGLYIAMQIIDKYKAESEEV